MKDHRLAKRLEMEGAIESTFVNFFTNQTFKEKYVLK